MIYIINQAFRNKNFELQAKCDDNKKIASKFTEGQQNLDRLLCTQKASFNKEEIGYNYFNKKKSYNNLFVKSTWHKKDARTSNYCYKIVHIAYSCLYKKSMSRIIQIWVPKGTRPPNMVANDFEFRYKVKSGRKVWIFVL